MAQVTVKKIVEGETAIIVRIDLLSDGTGELVNQVVLSPSDLIPVRPNNTPAFRIMQAWYGFVWFDVTVGFGTLQPSTVWTIPRDTTNHIDFRSFGGLVDYINTPPVDNNGKLWISTNGFAAAGSSGSIVLELKKVHKAR